MLPITRGGTYFRVFKPDWGDPLDMTKPKAAGGRWNAPGAFGALYLTATLAVAAANARAQHRNRAVGIFDLTPARRPSLLRVHVPRSQLLDVVNPHGVRALNLPANYPFGVTYDRCRPIGKRAYSSEK
ncbi:MAG: RES domain-containing protein, partial [Vulcanimicrobiaceae bacterium]